MQLTSEQIENIKEHWAIEDTPLFHRRVANYVYFTKFEGRDVVLRLTEPTHRSKKEIESELDWMNYLTKNKMKIAAPVKSKSGDYVVELSGKKYFAAIIEKAEGAFLDDDKEVSDEMIKIWGQYVGRLHRLTKDYKPAKNILPRQQWRQDESLAMALRSLDKSDEIPYQRMNDLLEWMTTLEKDIHSYGLIHSDLHCGNFFVKDNQITSFDYDDSCYHWFSYDIVAPVNSISKNLSEGVNNLANEKILEIFLNGYSKENNLEPAWINRIQVFDKFRAVMVYHWVKTFSKEGVFDEKGLLWAKEKLPKLYKAFKDPIQWL